MCPRRNAKARAREALEAVGLTEFADHYPGQLSGGMKQRAQLARALALKTEILLMDEPFAALDEQTRMVLGEDISVLLARTGKTIVFRHSQSCRSGISRGSRCGFQRASRPHQVRHSGRRRTSAKPHLHDIGKARPFAQ